MKNFLTKNLKNKLVILAICAAFYVALILISEFTSLGRKYLFAWTIDHLYCFSWIIVATLILVNALPTALFISAGNFAGVFLGHYLGTYLNEQAIAQFTPDPNKPNTIYIFEPNYPFAIWVLAVFGSLLLGIVVNIVISVIAKQKRKPQAENN